jgi:peptidoglycan hydrolase CwlO-like protein
MGDGRLDTVKIMSSTGVVAATVASLVVLAINYGIAKGETEQRVFKNEKDISELKKDSKETKEDINEINQTLIKIDAKIQVLLEENKKKKK